MSHLGFKILYSLINEEEDLIAERAYTPWIDMEAELRAHGEKIRSLESWRPLSDFDVVGFSLQFELTFTNILTLLDLGGIPLRSKDRSDDDPLILAGGPTATHCEPIAPFLDAVVIGDGESKAIEIMRTWSALKEAGVPRAQRLLALAKLGGIYVPSLYALQTEPQTGMRVVSGPTHPEAPFPIERHIVDDLNDYPFPTGGPVASTETIFDRVSVEIARGCTEGCRFCQAGMIYRPVRERDPEQIVETISEAVKEGGYDEASLTCLSTADYSAINPLVKSVMQKLEKERVSLSVSSLRAYGLDEELLDEIRKVRASGLTFAPEAGSQRMRDVVNKNITEEQMMQTAERVFARGWSRVKLYFMMGLPTEEEEDVRAIVQTGENVKRAGRRVGQGRPEVTVSVSIHVPKPHTPFQWCAMDTREQVLEKQNWLREEAHRSRVKLRMHDSDGSWLEGIISRGDQSLADVIEHAWKLGARFDSWDEQHKAAAWADAFETYQVEPERFLGTLPVSARLPWDHIDVGLEEGFLEKEYRKALNNRLSPPCGKAAGQHVHHTNLQESEADRRRLVCYDCGVACDLTSMRTERHDFLTRLGALEPAPPSVPVTQLVRKTKGKKRPPPRQAQGKVRRIRIQFAKVGRAAYRGHLDLVRVLPRIFRRIELPLYYSQGFHPKAEMVFSPALSLGISALSEYLDLKLDADVPYDYTNLVERLNKVTEPGIVFLSAHAISDRDRRLSRVINGAVYIAAIPRHALIDQGLDRQEALEALIAEKRQGPLLQERVIKKRAKVVDVNEYLLDVSVGCGGESLQKAGLVGDFIPLRFSTRITGGGTVKASEVVSALLGDVPARLVRENLFSETDNERIAPHLLGELQELTAAQAAH